MFIRASSLLLPVLVLSSVAAAAPGPIVARASSSCGNGSLQCCDNTVEVRPRILCRRLLTDLPNCRLRKPMPTNFLDSWELQLPFPLLARSSVLAARPSVSSA